MGTTMRIAALIALLAGACTSSGNENTVVQSQTTWDDALGVLQGACGACHGNASTYKDLAFLAGTTSEGIRDTLMASGVINFDEPNASRLFTKGIHEGPYLTTTQLDVILAWMESEAAGN